MRYKKLEEFYNSPEYLQKVKARFEVLRSCEDEPLNIHRMVLERWAVDPIDFIEQFGWISIPEFDNQVKPFFMFEYQKQVIRKIWAAELSGMDAEILIDKPRGMGLTWSIVWYQIWRWLFTPNWGGFNLSRSEAEVDDGGFDPNSSIFGKYRWCISKLPHFLIPEGFVPKGKKGNITDMSLRITNPQLQSSLVGSTTNQNAGRSRRYSFIFIDECFSIDYFQAVYRSLQSVARVKIFVSTVKAGRVFEDFKKMCEENGNYISLKWSDHPFKDQEWYEEQVKKAEFDPEVMKEIEVDYSVNIKSQYYPEIREAKVLPDVIYERGRQLYVSLDFGQQDLAVIIWWQFDGQFFKAVECFFNRRKPWDWYLPFLNPQLQMNPSLYSPYELKFLEKIRTWNKPNAYFGEIAFLKAESDNRSLMQKFASYSINILINNHAFEYEPRRRATSVLLKRTIFNSSSDGVMRLYDAISNSRYANSVRATTKEATLKPVHDAEIADFRAAAENFYVNVPRILRLNRENLGSEIKKDKSLVQGLTKYLKI